MPRWIDVSAPLHDGIVPWPGDPPFRIRRVSDIERGDSSTLSSVSMSAHAGTHMDAPLHFVRRGRTIDKLPLDATVGPARVIRIRAARVIGPDELRPHRIRAGERVLLRTRNSSRQPSRRFFKDYVALSLEAAQYLASRRIRVVGIDAPSIALFEKDMAETHRALLASGIWIIEGLDLRRASEGPCDLVCLPLRLMGADGAPARAILRSRR